MTRLTRTFSGTALAVMVIISALAMGLPVADVVAQEGNTEAPEFDGDAGEPSDIIIPSDQGGGVSQDLDGVTVDLNDEAGTDDRVNVFFDLTALDEAGIDKAARDSLDLDESQVTVHSESETEAVNVDENGDVAKIGFDVDDNDEQFTFDVPLEDLVDFSQADEETTHDLVYQTDIQLGDSLDAGDGDFGDHDTTVQFDVKPPGFGGEVTDQDDEPFVGEVEFVSDDAIDESVTIADEDDGEYEVVDVDTGEYDITASADGYEDDRVDGVEIQEGEFVENVDFTLEERPGSIHGTVTDAETGDDPEGQVILDGDETADLADGTYEFEGLDAGEYTVETDVADYEDESKEVTIDPGEDVTQDFGLEPSGASISGNITDSETGEPLDGSVELSGETAETTDLADGDYEFTGLEPGDYTVETDVDGYEDESKEVTVGPGEDETQDFGLDPLPGSIAGEIELADGEPEEPTDVTVTAEGEERGETYETEIQVGTEQASESYAFDDVRPDDYDVETDAEGYNDAHEGVTVEPNEDVTGVDFTLEGASSTILGVVTLGAAAPDGGTEVTVTAEDGGEYSDSVTIEAGETEESYEVDVPPGDYEVFAADEDEAFLGDTSDGTVAVGEDDEVSDVDLHLDAAALSGTVELDEETPEAVDVTVEAADGESIYDDEITLEPGEQTETYSIDLPGGDYTVTAADEGDSYGEDSSSVSLDAGTVRADEDFHLAATEDDDTTVDGGGGWDGSTDVSIPTTPTPTPTPTLTPDGEAWEPIEDDAPVEDGIEVTIGSTLVCSVQFHTDDADGNVIIEEATEVSADAYDVPPGASLAMADIGVPEPEQDTHATVCLQVSEQRLDRADADPEDLVVFHDDGDEWQELETRVDETGDPVIVAAETPGFSTFVVATDADDSTPGSTREPSTPVEGEEAAALPMMWILLGLLAVVLAALLAYRRRQES